MSNGEQWLAEYVRTGSEAAFREVVERYVNLVYSAGLRLVNGDAHLAQDVAQEVFTDLARMARKLSPDVKLGGWLHRHTCFVASNTMRRERRRELRERSAVEMNSMEEHENLALIAPVLDEAINELGSEDRDAIMLRFFEQKDFRSVGEALGSNGEAARKRVSRALDKLHGLLTRRGVVLSATALSATLTGHVVSAAPAGLALSISTAAVASAAAGSGTALTLIQIMAKAKVGIAAALVVAVAIPVAMGIREHNKLRAENETLRAQAAQVDQLTAENARLASLAAQAKAPAPAASNDPSRELLKLRGEVGRLRTEVTAPKPSPISSVISDPETRKMIREQQKMGMSMLYKEFGNRAKLSPEMGQKFVDVLADDIMENVDHVGALLQEGKSREEIDQVFTAQEAALSAKLKELLGPEGFAQYQDYTRSLASYLTAEQFKSEMSGDKEAKQAKGKQLYEAMLQETQAALAAAGLPEDFQTLPMLNFRNIASEQEAEKSLGLMESVFERATARAGSFLSPEEIQTFDKFRTEALANNRRALAMNRKMMAPGAR